MTPSMLNATCAPSAAVLVPLNTKTDALVLKSVALTPVSGEMAVKSMVCPATVVSLLPSGNNVSEVSTVMVCGVAERITTALLSNSWVLTLYTPSFKSDAYTACHAPLLTVVEKVMAAPALGVKVNFTTLPSFALDVPVNVSVLSLVMKSVPMMPVSALMLTKFKLNALLNNCCNLFCVLVCKPSSVLVSIACMNPERFALVTPEIPIRLKSFAVRV